MEGGRGGGKKGEREVEGGRGKGRGERGSGGGKKGEGKGETQLALQGKITYSLVFKTSVSTSATYVYASNLYLYKHACTS